MDNLNEPQEFDLDDILREFGDHPEENPAEEKDAELEALLKDAEPAAPEAPAEEAAPAPAEETVEPAAEQAETPVSDDDTLRFDPAE